MNANLTRAYVLGCAAVSGLLIASAAAETSEDANPYSVISAKNVFHLNPAPPPVAADPVKPPDLQKVMLSGFQKVGNRMRVYLAIPAKDPKDTAYLALQAGEKERDVEIVKIRADKQEVDILNTGTAMTLTIASNGFALSGGAPAAKPAGPATPGMPGNRHMPFAPGAPMPNNLPAAAAPPQVPSGGSAIVIGGGGGGISGGAQSYGSGGGASYEGGAIVSGGAPSYANTPGAVPGGGPATQIANSLFSGQNRVPLPENVIPAPPEVQAAGLLLHEAAGGPPSPIQAPP